MRGYTDDTRSHHVPGAHLRVGLSRNWSVFWKALNTGRCCHIIANAYSLRLHLGTIIFLLKSTDVSTPSYSTSVVPNQSCVMPHLGISKILMPRVIFNFCWYTLTVVRLKEVQKAIKFVFKLASKNMASMTEKNKKRKHS